MEDFVRQGYLEVIPQPNTDPLVKEIVWGQRAKHEFTKKNSLNFVSQVCISFYLYTYTTRWV